MPPCQRRDFLPCRPMENKIPERSAKFLLCSLVSLKRSIFLIILPFQALLFCKFLSRDWSDHFVAQDDCVWERAGFQNDFFEALRCGNKIKTPERSESKITGLNSGKARAEPEASVMWEAGEPVYVRLLSASL